MTRLVALAVVTISALGVPATLYGQDAKPSGPDRVDAIRRAHVWSPADTASKDLRLGPRERDGFAPGTTVTCDYVDKELSGKSPKFLCRVSPDDEIKVKFGGTNGEVFGEVAATRLFWALGFPADRMYPARVICRGCPEGFGTVGVATPHRVSDPAVIERKLPGTELTDDGDEGWKWKELDLVDEKAGGAPRAHRDALKLLAVMLQHTDSKPQQQRLLCMDTPPNAGACARPFMMINDLGLTFGRANFTNGNTTGSVNLREWSRTPIWKGAEGCVGNLPKSLTGTLNDPAITEGGRRFLADLLNQLSDAQLLDLFEGARFELRLRVPDEGRSGFPSAQEWVDAFKQKRAEINERRCPDAPL